jgi:hypothetical protein
MPTNAATVEGVLLEALASLELSGPDAIHEDDVMRILESLLNEIEHLDPGAKSRLRNAADEKARDATDQRRREFFRQAAETFHFD